MNGIEISGGVMMLIAIFLFFTSVAMCIIGVLKGNMKRVLRFIKLGFVTVLLFFLGLFISSAGMSSYWDYQKTDEDEEYNQEIIENIQRNEQKAEEETKKREEVARLEMKAAMRTPEESKSIAESLDYKAVIENIELYVGTYAKFQGEITELDATESYTYVALTLIDNPEYVVVVEFPGPVNQYVGDVVTAYGYVEEGDFYTTKSGNKVYAPILRSDIID
jgi:cell division protein FtsB